MSSPQQGSIQTTRDVWECPICKARSNLLQCPHCGTHYAARLRQDYQLNLVAKLVVAGVVAVLALGLLQVVLVFVFKAPGNHAY